MFNKESLKKAFLIFSLFVLVVFSFGLGWAVGYGRLEIERGKFPKIVNKASSQNAQVDFSLFWKAWDIVNEKFAGKTIDPVKMLYGAISGMLTSLDDPYTAFMDEEATKKFDEELKGTISGIGAEVGIKNKKLTIIAPIEDSPAAKAGLRPGDIILKIDNKETEGLTLEKAVSLIRGPENTEVTLLIERKSLTEPKEFKIKREVITVKSVKWEIKNNDIMDIQIVRFGEDTASKVKEAANEAVIKGIKKVIIDLRNDSGGYLDSAINVASEFISEGTIVIEKKDSKESKVFKVLEKGKLTSPDIKIVVLINEGSASASEIVAGALQDHKRGTLIGKKTFGKGSVQEIESLGQGTSLRITVAKWYTPLDRSINDQGLTPDVEVNLTDEDFNQGRDPQFDKAIEWLNKPQALESHPWVTENIVQKFCLLTFNYMQNFLNAG